MLPYRASNSKNIKVFNKQIASQRPTLSGDKGSTHTVVFKVSSSFK
jgi:hypothetical protein